MSFITIIVIVFTINYVRTDNVVDYKIDSKQLLSNVIQASNTSASPQCKSVIQIKALTEKVKTETEAYNNNTKRVNALKVSIASNTKILTKSELDLKVANAAYDKLAATVKSLETNKYDAQKANQTQFISNIDNNINLNKTNLAKQKLIINDLKDKISKLKPIMDSEASEFKKLSNVENTKYLLGNLNTAKSQLAIWSRLKLCPTTETNCTNKIDDDRNGYIDCADSKCSGDKACVGSGAGTTGTPENNDGGIFGKKKLPKTPTAACDEADKNDGISDNKGGFFGEVNVSLPFMDKTLSANSICSLVDVGCNGKWVLDGNSREELYDNGPNDRGIEYTWTCALPASYENGEGEKVKILCESKGCTLRKSSIVIKQEENLN